jgi:hypothetical protein
MVFFFAPEVCMMHVGLCALEIDSQVRLILATKASTLQVMSLEVALLK